MKKDMFSDDELHTIYKLIYARYKNMHFIIENDENKDSKQELIFEKMELDKLLRTFNDPEVVEFDEIDTKEIYTCLIEESKKLKVELDTAQGPRQRDIKRDLSVVDIIMEIFNEQKK